MGMKIEKRGKEKNKNGAEGVWAVRGRPGTDRERREGKREGEVTRYEKGGKRQNSERKGTKTHMGKERGKMRDDLNCCTLHTHVPIISLSTFSHSPILFLSLSLFVVSSPLFPLLVPLFPSFPFLPLFSFSSPSHPLQPCTALFSPNVFTNRRDASFKILRVPFFSLLPSLPFPPL